MLTQSWIRSIADSRFVARLFTSLGTVFLSASLTALTAGQVSAQSLAEPPAPQSPHWSHINIFDFGRALYLGFPSTTEQQWLTSHVDAIEVQGNASNVQAYNPTMKLSSYQLDMSIFAGNTVGLAEDWFLHFAETTTLTFYNLAKTQVVGTVTIPGCPVGTPISSSCRVQTYLWTNLRNIYNLTTPALQDWLATRILGSTNFYGASVGTNQLVWLDEHAPGFSWPFSFGYQTVINQGGRIRELNGYNAMDTTNIDPVYNTTVVNWLTYLAQRTVAVNKRVLINANAQVLNPMIAAQIKVIHGFDSESYFRPDGFQNATEFQQFINTVQQIVVSAGGWISLHGIWNYTGPSGYTAGNYSSSAARYQMWRLAGYYMVKEPVGSPGIVYFNPAFSSNEPPFAVSNDMSAWLPAYQVNVGQPTGNSYVHQGGLSGGVSYTIFGRAYTRAIVLLRPKDCASCTNYGDTSAVTVSFPSPVRVLREDGTLSTATSSVSIRNAEAVVVFTSADLTPPAPPAGLRVL